MTLEETIFLHGQLTEEERRVWLRIGRRLLAGQREYGKLEDNAKTVDGFSEDIREELADALVYSAIIAERA